MRVHGSTRLGQLRRHFQGSLLRAMEISNIQKIWSSLDSTTEESNDDLVMAFIVPTEFDMTIRCPDSAAQIQSIIDIVKVHFVGAGCDGPNSIGGWRLNRGHQCHPPPPSMRWGRHVALTHTTALSRPLPSRHGTALDLKKQAHAKDMPLDAGDTAQ